MEPHGAYSCIASFFLHVGLDSALSLCVVMVHSFVRSLPHVRRPCVLLLCTWALGTLLCLGHSEQCCYENSHPYFLVNVHVCFCQRNSEGWHCWAARCSLCRSCQFSRAVEQFLSRQEGVRVPLAPQPASTLALLRPVALHPVGLLPLPNLPEGMDC